MRKEVLGDQGGEVSHCGVLDGAGREDSLTAWTKARVLSSRWGVGGSAAASREDLEQAKLPTTVFSRPLGAVQPMRSGVRLGIRRRQKVKLAWAPGATHDDGAPIGWFIVETALWRTAAEEQGGGGPGTCGQPRQVVMSPALSVAAGRSPPRELVRREGRDW